MAVAQVRRRDYSRAQVRRRDYSRYSLTIYYCLTVALLFRRRSYVKKRCCRMVQ